MKKKTIVLSLLLVACLALSSCIVVNKAPAAPASEESSVLYLDEAVGDYWDRYVVDEAGAVTDAVSHLHCNSVSSLSYDHQPRVLSKESVKEIQAILREIEGHLVEKTADDSDWIPDRRGMYYKSLRLCMEGDVTLNSMSDLLSSSRPISFTIVKEGLPFLYLVSGGIVVCFDHNGERVAHYFRSDIDLTDKINQIAELTK